MRVRKSESHRALLLPVLLILAAAFLATSLTGMGDNSVTGAQVLSRGSVSRVCEWVELWRPDGGWVEAHCPIGKEHVVSGGCASFYADNLWTSVPIVRPHNSTNETAPDSWLCRFNTNRSAVAYAFCCK